MKVTLLALSAAIGFAGVAMSSDVKLPSSVFAMDELEEAKAEAAKKKEPLIFVYTNPAST